MDVDASDVPSIGTADETVSAGLRSLEAHVLEQWRSALQSADDAGIARWVRLGKAIRAVERTMEPAPEPRSGWTDALGAIERTMG